MRDAAKTLLHTPSSESKYEFGSRLRTMAQRHRGSRVWAGEKPRRQLLLQGKRKVAEEVDNSSIFTLDPAWEEKFFNKIKKFG